MYYLYGVSNIFLLEFMLLSHHQLRTQRNMLQLFLFINQMSLVAQWLKKKKSTCQCRRLRRCRRQGSIPESGLRRSPGGANGNPLQDSCLENLMNRGGWQATVHGVAVRHGWELTQYVWCMVYMVYAWYIPEQSLNFKKNY